MRFLIVFLLSALLFIPAYAQDDDPLYDQMQNIEAMTIMTRGLSPADETPVDVTFTTYEQEYAYYNSDFYYYDYTEAQFYFAFDLMATSTNLGKVYNTMNQENIGGYYQPGLDHITMILINEVGDFLTPSETLVYAHEYTHFLQDQNFNVGDLINDYSNSDRATAIRALVEGDAMFTEQTFATVAAEKYPEMTEYQTFDLIGDYTSSEVIPPILEAESFLPYLNGMTFIKALYNQGGWELVNSAYENPPQSTEHIIHPDRYLAEDMPLDVRIAPIEESLLGRGWTYYDRDTFGEFYLRQYLATQLDRETVDVAATGWGGDSYELYYTTERNKRAWLMRLMWDTPQDRTEFVTAYRTFAELRMEVPVRIVDERMECWENIGFGEVLCLQVGEDTIISYAPTIREATTMINDQRG